MSLGTLHFKDVTQHFLCEGVSDFVQGVSVSAIRFSTVFDHSPSTILKRGRNFPAVHQHSVCLPGKGRPAPRAHTGCYMSDSAASTFAHPWAFVYSLAPGCTKAVRQFWLWFQFRWPLALLATSALPTPFSGVRGWLWQIGVPLNWGLSSLPVISSQTLL